MEEKYYYWLHNVPGMGKETIKKLLQITTPEQLFEDSLDKVKNIIKETQMEQLLKSRSMWNLEEEWTRLQKQNIKFIYYGSKEYPKKLMQIPDPPLCLYQKGKKECFQKPAIAVIGARNCSMYGGLAAKELGKELAKIGVVVISGMARGIDGICQWAALEQGGESIGVLGSGVEVCYPKENRNLYERLQKSGCLVSESPPFTQPRAGLFPIRNRIISGLADMVVVVEAAQKSGTLITVDMALEQGKEVFAIPGRMTDKYSRGCNNLIKQGAGMILSPKEFVEEIRQMLELPTQKREDGEGEWEEELTKEERSVLSVIGIDMKTMEEIYIEAKRMNEKITLVNVMESVLKLRMKQFVGEKDGYYFKLKSF